MDALSVTIQTKTEFYRPNSWLLLELTLPSLEIPPLQSKQIAR